jgi:hypothetical protein
LLLLLLLRRVFSSISAMGFLDELRLSAGVGPAVGTTPQAFSLPTVAILAGDAHLGDAHLMAAGDGARPFSLVLWLPAPPPPLRSRLPDRFRCRI